MFAYSTYVSGTQAVYFDWPALQRMRSDSMFWWRMSYKYASNWRILHIDGFEGYLWNRKGLPGHQGSNAIFFTYAGPVFEK